MEQEWRQAGLLQVAIIVLTTVTATIHLILAMLGGSPLFYLTAVGYFVLLIAPYHKSLYRLRPLFRWLLLGYTTLVFVLWIPFGEQSTIAYFDKTIEIVLFVLLWRDKVEQ